MAEANRTLMLTLKTRGIITTPLLWTLCSTPALGSLTWFDWFHVSVLHILSVANGEADPNYVHLVLSVLHWRPGNCQRPAVGGLLVEGWFHQDPGQRILHLTGDFFIMNIRKFRRRSWLIKVISEPNRNNRTSEMKRWKFAKICTALPDCIYLLVCNNLQKKNM